MDVIKNLTGGIEKKPDFRNAYREAVRAAKSKTPFEGTDLATLFHRQSEWMISEPEAVNIETEILGERKEAFFERITAADPAAAKPPPPEGVPPSDSLFGTFVIGLLGAGGLAALVLAVIACGPFSGLRELWNSHYDALIRGAIGSTIGAGVLFGVLSIFASEYEYRKAGGTGLVSPYLKDGVAEILGLLLLAVVVCLIVLAVKKSILGWVWAVLWVLCLPLVGGLLTGFHPASIMGKFLYYMPRFGIGLWAYSPPVPALARRRAVATIIDLIVSMVSLAFIFAVTRESGGALCSASAIFLWVYYGVLECKFATIGKLIAGLRVRKVGAANLSIRRATARLAGKLLFLGIVEAFFGIPIYFILVRTVPVPTRDGLFALIVILMLGLVLLRFRYHPEHFYDKLAKCHVVRMGTR